MAGFLSGWISLRLDFSQAWYLQGKYQSTFCCSYKLSHCMELGGIYLKLDTVRFSGWISLRLDRHSSILRLDFSQALYLTLQAVAAVVSTKVLSAATSELGINSSHLACAVITPFIGLHNSKSHTKCLW